MSIFDTCSCPQFFYKYNKYILYFIIRLYHFVYIFCWFMFELSPIFLLLHIFLYMCLIMYVCQIFLVHIFRNGIAWLQIWASPPLLPNCCLKWLNWFDFLSLLYDILPVWCEIVSQCSVKLHCADFEHLMLFHSDFRFC